MSVEQWPDMVLPDQTQPDIIEVIDHEIAVPDLPLWANVLDQSRVQMLEQLHNIASERRIFLRNVFTQLRRYDA